jgi:tricarballylate dehydrogenase
MIDVLVIGGGNAALCAALTAREAGASVLLLEAAPREWRGGNSMHTRNLRCMHDAPQDVLTEAYPEEEFWQDLLKVTAGRTDEALARQVIRESSTLPRLDAPARRALPAVAVGHAAPEPHQRVLHGRRQGAGQCLLPQRAGAGGAVRYDAPVQQLELDGSAFVAAHLADGATHRGPRLRGGQRRLRVQHRAGCARPGAATSAASGRPTAS